MFDAEDMKSTASGYPLCPECSEKLPSCDYCGAKCIEIEIDYYDHLQLKLCKSCSGTDLAECADCGEMFPKEDMREFGEEQWYCKECKKHVFQERAIYDDQIALPNKDENVAIAFDIETLPIDDRDLTPMLIEELRDKLEKNKEKKNIEDENQLEMEKNKLKAVTPEFGQIICIGLKFEFGKHEFEGVFLDDDEEALLTEFWEFLGTVNPKRTQFVSFNGLSFDVPYIITRSAVHSVKPTIKSFLDLRRYQRFPHFDVCELLANWNNLKKRKLSVVCDLLGIGNPKLFANGSDVSRLHAQGKYDEIRTYCLGDVQATYDIYQRIKDFYPEGYADRQARTYAE